MTTLERTMVEQWLWQPVKHDAPYIEKVTKELQQVEPEVSLCHHGQGQISGCVWTLYVDADGVSTGRRHGAWPPNTAEMWEVSCSYRGPLITALSWHSPHLSNDTVTSPRLVAWVQNIATKLDLIYLDSEELVACKVPPNEWPNEDVCLRLDLTEDDDANAFNLLFYE